MAIITVDEKVAELMMLMKTMFIISNKVSQLAETNLSLLVTVLAMFLLEHPADIPWIVNTIPGIDVAAVETLDKCGFSCFIDALDNQMADYERDILHTTSLLINAILCQHRARNIHEDVLHREMDSIIRHVRQGIQQERIVDIEHMPIFSKMF